MYIYIYYIGCINVYTAYHIMHVHLEYASKHVERTNIHVFNLLEPLHPPPFGVAAGKPARGFRRISLSPLGEYLLAELLGIHSE